MSRWKENKPKSQGHWEFTTVILSHVKLTLDELQEKYKRLGWTFLTLVEEAAKVIDEGFMIGKELAALFVRSYEPNIKRRRRRRGKPYRQIFSWFMAIPELGDDDYRDPNMYPEDLNVFDPDWAIPGFQPLPMP